MHYLKAMTLSIWLALIPGTVLAGWGEQIGGWLTNLPLLDTLADRIQENRIAYIRSSRGYPPGTLAQVRRNLGARANVRNRPGTSSGSRIIARLRPGTVVEVIAPVPDTPWLRIRLAPHQQGFIYGKLVNLRIATSDRSR